MPKRKSIQEKNFNINNGSKSNNLETNTRNDDLALVNTVFIPVEREKEKITDEQIKEAIVLPNGATNIDFMMPEEEKEILQKNLDMYSDTEKMHKLLSLAKKNKLISEDLKTMEIISELGALGMGVTQVLASEQNLQVLNQYIQNLLESGGDVAKAYKEAALASKAMLDARETMLAKIKAKQSGKAAKIALKFTNSDGEEYALGASIDG